MKENKDMNIFDQIPMNQSLSEDESKKILDAFNIPVVPEKRASNVEEAVRISLKYGFPVALKGVGRLLSHKTEKGLVKTNLNSETSVKEAAYEIYNNAGKDIEALLVQPMIQGRREFVTGMFRDPQFGPVIMFGLGGIFTEALNDVSFKLAPLTEQDIKEMLSELACRKLLDDFRGEKRVDIKMIKAVLSGLSRLAMELPQISEVDINPLIVRPDGSIIAVDALIVTGEPKGKTDTRPSVDKLQLGQIFYPKSVAFVGASSTIGKWGHMLPVNTLSGNYKGEVFLVNPRGGTIMGREVYKSVTDIDEAIDLAVVTIPADKIPGIISQLRQKKVKGMLLITSGFSETGDKGALLEKEIVKKAHEAGIIILGPNTMGICNPHMGFACSGAHVHPMPGSTALVCQSGNMGTQLLAFAQQQGIGIRAFSGSGNEAMVTIEDYMEVFEIDEKTQSVVLYIESVKNGRRFFESAKKLSKKKPVVVLTGGRTPEGGKAAASHTGALASNTRVMSATLRQAGIIEVNQPMDMLDLSAIFSSLPLPKGNRVAIMTLGGGWGVITTDLCAEHKLIIPQLSHDIICSLNKMLPSYWSHANPVDIVGEKDPRIPMTAVEELLKWDECDAVIHLGIHGRRLFSDKMIDSMGKVDKGQSGESLQVIKDATIKIETDYVNHIIKLTEVYEKPVLGVSLLTNDKIKSIYRLKGSKYNGVFFPSPERAVKALSCMCRYADWLKHH